MAFSPFGIFDLYNQVQGFDASKAGQAIQTSNYANQLNQANNNLAITKEQAPLVPQQAAESFAARGVGQSTFGNGLGNSAGQAPQQPTNQNFYTDPSTGARGLNSAFVAPTTPKGLGPGAPGGYSQGLAGLTSGPVRSFMTNGSGQGYGAGSGLQRARDLSASMVSNATSGQTAAQNAVADYQGVVNHTRNQFYGQIAEDVLGTLALVAGVL